MSDEPKDTAAAVIADHLLPTLRLEAKRLHERAKKRTLMDDEPRNLLEYMRAAVAARYVELKEADADKKQGGDEDWSNMSTEQLHAKLRELTAKAFPQYNGTNLQSLRAPKGS